MNGSIDEIILYDKYGGRLPDDLKILQRIQEDTGNHRRQEVRKYRQRQIQNEINEGSRMMKFATAAYATSKLHGLMDADSSAVL